MTCFPSVWMSATWWLILSSGIDKLKKAGMCTLSMTKMLSARIQEAKGINDQCVRVPRVTHADPEHLLLLSSSRFVLVVSLLVEEKAAIVGSTPSRDERNGTSITRRDPRSTATGRLAHRHRQREVGTVRPRGRSHHTPNPNAIATFTRH